MVQIVEVVQTVNGKQQMVIGMSYPTAHIPNSQFEIRNWKASRKRQRVSGKPYKGLFVIRYTLQLRNSLVPQIPNSHFEIVFYPLSSVICRLTPSRQSRSGKNLTLRVLHLIFPLDGIETDGKLLVPRPHYFVQLFKFKVLSEFWKKSVGW